MDNSLLPIIKKLIKILPSDWNKMVFSLFVRECTLNEKKAYSKEFKCLCLADSCEFPIDLVKVYEEDYVVEDLFFSFLNYMYDNYLKNNKHENLVVFKLNKDGSFEFIKFPNLDNDCDNNTIKDIVNKCLY